MRKRVQSSLTWSPGLETDKSLLPSAFKTLKTDGPPGTDSATGKQKNEAKVQIIKFDFPILDVAAFWIGSSRAIRKGGREGAPLPCLVVQAPRGAVFPPQKLSEGSEPQRTFTQSCDVMKGAWLLGNQRILLHLSPSWVGP